MEKEELLDHLRRLRTQVEDFERRGNDFLQGLPYLTEEDFAASTPEAELQGTLECLLGDDLQPALRKLAELEDYLRGAQPSGC